MEIEVGRYYQDGDGQIVKVLAREQKQMLPPMDENGHLDLDPAHAVLVESFRCWDYEGDDYYVLPTGQACHTWKGEGDQSIYSVPTYSSLQDLVKEADPDDIEEE